MLRYNVSHMGQHFFQLAGETERRGRFWFQEFLKPLDVSLGARCVLLTRRLQMLEKTKECAKARKRVRVFSLLYFFPRRMKSLFSRSVHPNSIWLLREVEGKLAWPGCFFPGCPAPAGRSLKEKLGNERKGTSKLEPCHRGPSPTICRSVSRP